MLDYKRNDPRGWCGDPSRGAALGRPTIHAPDFAGRLTIRRVRLNQGGYDINGTYFGIGAPLYWVASVEGEEWAAAVEVDYMLRARDRQSAKAMVKVRYPNARFYR